jgi:type IV secretory pathway TraG/TraD family ATPase VirD4
MLEKMAIDPSRTIKGFVDALCIQPLSELFALLQLTPGAAYLDPKGEKGSHAIRTSIINGINDFSLLKESPNPFSVRDWILDEREEDQWLFLSCTEEQRHSLRVLMSIWTSVAVEALKSRNQKTAAEHPIFIAIDELHSLQKLECLKGAAAELRKYWGCLMLATQNISQLDSIYGHDITRVIIDSCGTKVCFRQTEKESAKRMSFFFGENQIKETQEGVSYGANDMRDGVTLSTVERTRAVVSSSDIQELPDLTAYLKLSNPPKRFRFLRAKSLPATKVSFKYKSFPLLAEKCIEEIPSGLFQESSSVEIEEEEMDPSERTTTHQPAQN